MQREEAVQAITEFLDEEVGGNPNFQFDLQGDGTWAFWILGEDTTSYLHPDGSIEWYGTEWDEEHEDYQWTGRLPDGSVTEDAGVYVANWRELARPFEDALGWRAFGFDPGISFLLYDKPNAPTLALPLDAVLQLRPFLLLPGAWKSLHDRLGFLYFPPTPNPTTVSAAFHRVPTQAELDALKKP